jgi:hypothetical protein
MIKRILTASAITLASSATFAAGLDFDQAQVGFDQDNFRGISEDMGSAFNYKNLRPAEPTGLLGFDISANLSYTPVAHQEDWDAAFNSEVDALGALGVSAAKGLPLGIDVGAYYGIIPDEEIKFVGATAAYALAEGSVVSPAISIRGSFMDVSGIDDLDFDTKSLEISMSKGLTLVTPYIGAGKVWVTSTPTSASLQALNISEEKFSMTKAFGGIKIAIPGIQFTAEVDKTGDATSYSVRAGFGL